MGFFDFLQPPEQEQNLLPEPPRFRVEESSLQKTNEGLETKTNTVRGEIQTYFYLEDNPNRLYRFFVMSPDAITLCIIWACDLKTAKKLAQVKAGADQYEVIKAG